MIPRFGDISDSTILKFLKFLTKVLGKAILYSTAIIKVWLDKTFVYFNCSVHGMETNGLTRLRASTPEDTLV